MQQLGCFGFSGVEEASLGGLQYVPCGVSSGFWPILYVSWSVYVSSSGILSCSYTCCIVFQVFTGPLFVPHCDHHACESLRLYSSVPVWMMYASSSCMLLLLCFIFLAPVHEVCTFFYHQPHAFCPFFYPLTHVGCIFSVLSHFGPLLFFPFWPSFFDPYSYVVIHQVIIHSSRVIESLRIIIYSIWSFSLSRSIGCH